MKKVLLGIFVLGFCIFSVPAHALIIDLPDVSGTGYFQDQNTGKTWMDVDNFVDMTYSQVESSLSGTGFHLANYSELTALWASAPADPTQFSSHYSIMGGSPHYGNVNDPIIWGWYNDDRSTTTGEWWSHKYSYMTYWAEGNSGGYPNAISLGAFVVEGENDGGNNAVPEPATMVLLGTGLVGMAFRRRKS